MKCPKCGATKMVHETRDVRYVCKGKSIVLPQITGDCCAECSELILDAAESRRVSAIMSKFGKKIDAVKRKC